VLPTFYDRDAADLPTRWVERVRHTLENLGPKVLASRMVRDYAVDYYAPSAESARAAVADDFAGAREVAEFRRRIESQWPSVAVEQVDGSGLPDTPEIGATISLTAKVRLGGLSVSDVEVQAVLGRVSPGEELTDVVTFPMTHFGAEDGTEIFEAEVALPVSGSVGYTVRVLPHHRLLVNASELGLVTTPNV
jgi:starch phosphorylase